MTQPPALREFTGQAAGRVKQADPGRLLRWRRQNLRVWRAWASWSPQSRVGERRELHKERIWGNLFSLQPNADQLTHARKLRRPRQRALERIRRCKAQHSPRPGTTHVLTASFQKLLIHRALAEQSTQMGLAFGVDKMASGKSHARRTSTPRPTQPSSWNEPKTGRTLEASSPPMGFSLYTYYAQGAIGLYDSTRLGPWLPTLCLPVPFPC